MRARDVPSHDSGRRGYRRELPNAPAAPQSRRRGIRAVLPVVCLCAAIMAVVACDGAAGRTKTAAERSPQKCDTRQLRVARGAHVGGLLGVGVIDITISNTSSEKCQLSGYPRVVLLKTRYKRVSVTVVHGALAPKEPTKLSAVSLSARGGRATFGLSFVDHPGPSSVTDCVKFRFVRFRLPGQQRIDTTSITPRTEVCGGSPHPRLDVSPIGLAVKR
jgi:hypothetical protein